jgi:outer membrane translocation and assembly module TamA
MKYWLTTFLISVQLFVCAQGVKLFVTSADKSPDFFQKKFSYKTQFKDSSAANSEIANLVRVLRNNGYIATSIDSTVSDSAQFSTYIYVGEKFNEVSLTNGNLTEDLINASGIKNYILRAKPVPFANLEFIKQRIVQQCENTGYPFTEVWLDSFTVIGNTYSAKVYVEKHELFRYDTLGVLGKTKMKRAFLKNYLGIKLNRPYNESNIKRINQRLNELPFVEVLKPHAIIFDKEKARVNLFLKDRKASDFNFLLGLLPGSSGQKLLITGEARIRLLSQFGMGEEFFLQWKKLQPKTQELEVRFSYPYLVGLPLGISAKFNLYKRDTTWLDLDGDYGVQYQIIGSNYLKASLKQKNTIILNVDTSYIKANRTLPRNLDISTNEFALEYFLQHLDYRFNPTKGYVLQVNSSAGVKKIRKNNTVASLYDEVAGKNFEYLYDTTRIRSFQCRFGLMIEKYWRLAPRHTIKTSFDGKYFYARLIFENEKYRIGGVNSLRGFDDQSIYTPYYGIGNVEYRFLLSKNSYFSAFFNAAVVQDNRTGKTVDFPYGFGAGAAVETKAGIFGITYAMGTQLENKITFRSAKIHIGYVNYF